MASSHSSRCFPCISAFQTIVAAKLEKSLYYHHSFPDISHNFFGLYFNSRWHGSPLFVEKIDDETADDEKLNYEFVGEDLHVSGIMKVPCNDNLYIYCTEEGSYNDRTLTFKVEQVGTQTDSYQLGKVDIWLRGFDEETSPQHGIYIQNGKKVMK